MDELVDWLTAQYDADEAYARNAFGEHNDAGAEWREVWSGGLEVGGEVIDTNDSQVSRFMERFDPAAVLADIASKREILTEHYVFSTMVGVQAVRACRRCSDFERPGEVLHAEPGPCRTVRLLGQAYAARDGYREQWRPGPFG